ncbi:MAG: hypothetical protein HY538_01465 [Deltaproteobacteria bacterium]|nr:hypothetical protein [Deltaproteobacteria bacterium]
MSASEILQYLSPRQKQVSKGLLFLLSGLVAVGAVAFIVGIQGASPSRIWTAYLVNFVYWTGIAQGAILLAVARQIVNAGWGKAIHRIAQSFSLFLPVSFLLFWILFFGRHELFEWVRHPVPEKAAWLNTPFLFLRDGLGLLLLFGLSLRFVLLSLREDLILTVDHLSDWRKNLYTRLIQRCPDEEKTKRQLAILSPIVVIAYAVVFTILAWDLIMSLDPHWVSTLFGAFYFVGSFFSGLILISIVAIFLRWRLGLDRWIGTSTLHDMGKLVFAFSIFWTYFFWSQYLVIWYGNLPEETEWFAKRQFGPYRNLSHLVLCLNFLAPFILLLVRKVKETAWAFGAIAFIPLIGMWLERYVLVAPSVLGTTQVWLGLPEALISLGFAALFFLCFLAFFRTFPILPVQDLSEGSSTHSHS